MKRVLVSRALPDSVQAAMRERFDVTVRPEKTPMPHDEVVAALRDYDAVLPTLGDAFRAAAFAEVPQPRVTMLANFGVGYNHIDVDAAQTTRIAGNLGDK